MNATTWTSRGLTLALFLGSVLGPVTRGNEAVGTVIPVPSDVGTLTEYGRRTPIYVSPVDMHSSRWQIRYLPLVVPLAGPNGQLVTRVEGTQLWVRMVLDDEHVRAAAADAVRARYPECADQVLASNARALGGVLQVSAPELQGTGVRLARSSFSYENTVPELEWLRFECGTAEEARAFIERAPTVTLEYRYVAQGQLVTRNAARAVYRRERLSRLRAALDGIARDGQAHIHRDDLRNFGLDDREEALVVRWREDRDWVPMIDQWVARAMDFGDQALVLLDDQVLATTYNGDDLRADHLTRVFEDSFEKVRTENRTRYIYKGNVSSSGSVAKFMKSSFKVGGSYDATDLERFAREHGLKIEVEGDIIQVKSVEVVRVNLATLDSLTSWSELDVRSLGPADLVLASQTVLGDARSPSRDLIEELETWRRTVGILEQRITSLEGRIADHREARTKVVAGRAGWKGQVMLYLRMDGGSVTLPPGRWLLLGDVHYSHGPQPVPYHLFVAGFSSTPGSNGATEPSWLQSPAVSYQSGVVIKTLAISPVPIVVTEGERTVHLVAAFRAGPDGGTCGAEHARVSGSIVAIPY